MKMYIWKRIAKKPWLNRIRKWQLNITFCWRGDKKEKTKGVSVIVWYVFC